MSFEKLIEKNTCCISLFVSTFEHINSKIGLYVYRETRILQSYRLLYRNIFQYSSKIARKPLKIPFKWHNTKHQWKGSTSLYNFLSVMFIARAIVKGKCSSITLFE